MSSSGYRHNLQDGHWVGIARQWSQVGPPLRPSHEDLRFVEHAVDRLCESAGPPRVLILGVTPEFYRLPWPEATDVFAADHTQAMIDHIWPGPAGTAHLTEWTSLPFAAASCDIVLCDGGLHLVKYPDDTSRLVHELRRMLAPGGLCILRLFIPPTKRETVQSVLADLQGGRIASLNHLKFRLWMALHDHPAEGVELGTVWNTLHTGAPDLESLAGRIGWSSEHILAINTYRNSESRYYFTGMDDVTRLFSEDPGGFEIESVHVPTYELGEQCPTVVLKRTASEPPR